MNELSSTLFDANRWMDEALYEAERASLLHEVPVGCVIVFENQIIGRAFNQKETQKNPLAHAEILAIEQASRFLGCWRLSGASVYVTLEPCIMCAGALIHARISHLFYGCSDPKSGACHSLYEVGQDSRLNHQYSVHSGIREQESVALLQRFFRQRRAEKKLLKQSLSPHMERWPSG